MVSLCALLKVGDNMWMTLSLAPAVLSAHFSIEFRAHFTGIYATSVGVVGATEQLVIVMLIHLIAALSWDSNDVFETTLSLGDYTPTITELLLMFGSMAGLNFNFHNIVTAIFEGKEPTHALLSVLPFAAFFAMLKISSESQFYS